VDTLAGRMARLREDERFKAVGPDSIVLPYPTPANAQIGLKPEGENEGEIWFDWAFVDFWKSNYCKLRIHLLALRADMWFRYGAEGICE
jgi:intracellular protein transport protein USO1